MTLVKKEIRAILKKAWAGVKQTIVTRMALDRMRF